MEYTQNLLLTWLRRLAYFPRKTETQGSIRKR
jgi:hypothetical protein